MWYRIFARSDVTLAPDDLVARLHDAGLEVVGQFRGDDLGWTGGELRLATGAPAYLERYLTKEDDLRHDLNSWAAFLETCDHSPNHGPLMERVIQTVQLVTLRRPIDAPDEVRMEHLCVEVCRQLAAAGDGLYQIDDLGWFAADGSLLLQEY